MSVDKFGRNIKSICHLREYNKADYSKLLKYNNNNIDSYLNSYINKLYLYVLDIIYVGPHIDKSLGFYKLDTGESYYTIPFEECQLEEIKIHNSTSKSLPFTIFHNNSFIGFYGITKILLKKGDTIGIKQVSKSFNKIFEIHFMFKFKICT